MLRHVLVALLERVEELADLLGLDANAGVLDRDLQLHALVAGAHVNVPAVRRELGRIANQVPQHLLQPRAIGQHIVMLGHFVDMDVLLLDLNLTAEQFQHAVDDLVHVHRFERQAQLAVRHPGEIEQIVDEARLEFDVAANHQHA